MIFIYKQCFINIFCYILRKRLKIYLNSFMTVFDRHKSNNNSNRVLFYCHFFMLNVIVMFACACPTDLKLFLCDDQNEPLPSEAVGYSLGQPNALRSMSWCKNNKYMAILRQECMPEILSTSGYTVKLVQRIRAFGDATVVSFKSCTKRHLCVGTKCGNVIEYDTICKSCNMCYPRLQSEVLHLDYNSNDSCLAAASIDGSITLYNTYSEGVAVNYILPSLVHATTMQFHNEDERILSAGTENGEVLIWDVTTDHRIVCAQAHLSNVRGVIITHSDIFVSAGDDGRICFYSLNSNSYVFRNNSTETFSSLSISNDEKMLAVSSKSGKVYFYDMRYCMKPSKVMQVYETEIYKILYSNKIQERTANSEVPILDCNQCASTDDSENVKFNCLLYDEDKNKVDSDSDIIDSHRTELEDIDSLAASKDDGKELDLELQKMKNEIVEAFNIQIIDLAVEFDKCIIDISTYVNEQLKTLEKTIDISYATVLDVMDDKNCALNGSLL